MHTNSNRCRGLIFFALIFLFGGSAYDVACAAGALPTASVPHGNVTLLSDAGSISAHGDFSLAFHFKLEPGWHIYWSNPGDSGEAPRLVWHLPAGLTAGQIEWPAPKRLPAPGVMDFGYTDDVVLLVPVRNAGSLAAGKAADLGVQVKLVICREVCIPGGAQLSLSVPVAAARVATDPSTMKIFDAARARLPKPVPAAWKISVRQSKSELLLNVDSGKSESAATFFPLEEDQIDNAAAQKVEAGPKGFRMHLKPSDQLTHPLKQLRGLLEVGGGAYTFEVPVTTSGA